MDPITGTSIIDSMCQGIGFFIAIVCYVVSRG